VPATRVSDQVFTLRRNPYFIAVDPDGNQLPQARWQPPGATNA
jgi:hypothetical protein